MAVASDVEGVTAICDWLAFVPRTRHSPVPILPSMDLIGRPVRFTPTKAPYDPRFMLAGRYLRG